MDLLDTHSPKERDSVLGHKQETDLDHFGSLGLNPIQPGDDAPSRAANSSPQVQQLMAYQRAATTSPQVQEAMQLQARINQSVSTGQGPVHRTASPVANQTGMSDDTKSNMEDGFDMDFSNVRIHTDSEAPLQLGAKAMASGTNIHFAPGAYKEDTPDGRQLLGHELAHVVQQYQGQVRATTEGAGREINTESNLEAEADQMAVEAGSGEVVQATKAQRTVIPTNNQGVAQLWPPKSVEEANKELEKLESEIFNKKVIMSYYYRGLKQLPLDEVKKSFFDGEYKDYAELQVIDPGTSGFSNKQCFQKIELYSRLRRWKKNEQGIGQGFGYGNIESLHFGTKSKFQNTFSFNPFAPELHNKPFNSISNDQTFEYLGDDIMVRNKSKEKLKEQRSKSKAYRQPSKKKTLFDDPTFGEDIFSNDFTDIDKKRVSKWKQEKRGKIANTGPYKNKNWPDQNKIMGMSAQNTVLSANKSANLDLNPKLPYQWLHIFAFSMGGKDNHNPQDPQNFVIGTEYANYYHLIFESIAKELASKKDVTIRVEATPKDPVAPKWRIYGKMEYSFSLMGKSKPTFFNPSVEYKKKTITRTIDCLGKPNVHSNDKDVIKETILADLGMPSQKYMEQLDLVLNKNNPFNGPLKPLEVMNDNTLFEDVYNDFNDSNLYSNEVVDIEDNVDEDMNDNGMEIEEDEDVNMY